MSYNHLTLTERARIEVLRQENYSLRSIARKLKRSVSTISREISRNNLNQSYQAETAQKNYETKRKLCGRPTRFTPELGNIIKYYLKCHWSPEQIVGRLLQNQICFKTIYRWINS
ncbi:TPA: IS30 family transposase, partial [Staphylococcus aureus]